MKRQRNVANGHVNVKDAKAEARAAAAAATPTTMTMGKKKGKTRPIDQEVEEERKKIGESSGVEMENNLVGWEDEYWPCLLRGVVDEQMSWGSIWLPFWDVEYMGEACTQMFSDVVWDDDIWNLKDITNKSIE